ncbi:hypothetical protein OUZ56_003307 [Daphnia magna]|uniref:Uncharacterized protein n=1 Tax=Daphnia magna TaxID=35525 RepID=A0ABR0A8D6_9CRUS|nr:hypothetical protein OUZ56_003307 [Daphnia magna]
MSFLASSNATSCNANRSSDTSAATAARVLTDLGLCGDFNTTSSSSEVEIPCLRNCLASAFSVRAGLLRLPLLDQGVSFRECLLLLRDLEDFDDHTGVTKMASGAGVDGPGCGTAAGSGVMFSTVGLTIGEGT